MSDTDCDHVWISLRRLCDGDDYQICGSCAAKRIVRDDDPPSP